MRKLLPSTLPKGLWLIAAALLMFPADVGAQSVPSEQELLQALTKPKATFKTRGVRSLSRTRSLSPMADDEQVKARSAFVRSLKVKSTRGLSISSGERKELASVAAEQPGVDLEIPFEFNSADISPQARPVLETLARVLRNDELVKATFLIAGHTDASGTEAYNQSLSERRAARIRRYLVEEHGLSFEQLLAVGYGEENLKNTADPRHADNRRVQIVNLETGETP